MEKIIVLVRPESSLNIGAVCRVMANTGLNSLRIAGKKEDYNSEEVTRLAIHAKYIWEKTVFFSPSVQGLKEACADCNILIGTTKRIGAKRKTQGITPENLADFLQDYGTGKAAIIFGNERTGLTDEELKVCSIAVNIPADKSFGSYNLSHAVLIIAYTLFISASKTKTLYDSKISFEETEKTAESINNYLKELGMFRCGGLEDNKVFLSEIIARAGLTKQEAAKLENIFKKIFFIKTKKQAHPMPDSRRDKIADC